MNGSQWESILEWFWCSCGCGHVLISLLSRKETQRKTKKTPPFHFMNWWLLFLQSMAAAYINLSTNTYPVTWIKQICYCWWCISILFYHHNIWKPMQILLRLRQTETLSDKNVYHSHCIQPLLWLLCCNSLIKNETVQSYLWTLNKSIDVWLLLWVIHCIAVLAMVLLWSRFCLLNIISRH